MTYAETAVLCPEDASCIFGARPAHSRHPGRDRLSWGVEVKRHQLNRQQYLYHAGQPFRSLFMVHAGSVKACELASDGREHVSGFPMNGDLVGVESVGMGNYACDVVALESSEVWELPYRLLLGACMVHPELQIRLSAILAAEIRRLRVWALTLATHSAPQRVAGFLLELAARYQSRGYSGSHFILRMSRKEIASYLVLQHETVSRALTQLANSRFIAVERNEVRILEHGAMALLVEQGDEPN
jgi:CRP/FNR family transcriptional regulator